MIAISSKFEYVSFRNKIGELHRLDGPAFINENYQEWWVNGKRHRLDGPAIIEGNFKEWYIDHVYYMNESEYYEKLKEMGLG